MSEESPLLGTGFKFVFVQENLKLSGGGHTNVSDPERSYKAVLHQAHFWDFRIVPGLNTAVPAWALHRSCIRAICVVLNFQMRREMKVYQPSTK